MSRQVIKHDDQQGMVSFVIVSVVVVMVALLTLGFSRLMDRNLRQALDRELALQANYAAESGLNDARSYVVSYFDQHKTVPSSYATQCVPRSDFSGTAFTDSISQIFDVNNSLVDYPCVLINPAPKDLLYSVSNGGTIIFKTEKQIDTLYIGWENTQYNPNSDGSITRRPLGTYHNLPQENRLNANATGLLRLTIFPIKQDADYGNDPNQAVTTDSKTLFLYPNSVGSPGTFGVVDFNSAQEFVPGNCNNDNKTSPPPYPYTKTVNRYCNVKVTGIPNGIYDPRTGHKWSKYYIRLSAVYRDLSVTIEANPPGSTTAVNITDAQALIDVTGKGNDLLKRIESRVSYSDIFPYPFAALQSNDIICKRFRLSQVAPTNSDNPYSVATPEYPCGLPD